MDMQLVVDVAGIGLLATVSVSLWTRRVAVAAAGRRLAAAVIAGAEAVLFALVFGAVISSHGDPLRVGAYAPAASLLVDYEEERSRCRRPARTAWSSTAGASPPVSR